MTKHDVAAHHQATAAISRLLADLPDDSGFAAWNAGNALGRFGGPIFFHITDIDEPFNVFCKSDSCSIGSHFGTLYAAEDRRQIIYRMVAPEEREGFLIPVVISAKNPLAIPDCQDWHFDRICETLVEGGDIDQDEADWVLDQDDAEAALYALLEAKGYDALVYSNEHEGVNFLPGRIAAFPEGEANFSILVWRPEQVKSPFSARFNPDDPRLMSQTEMSREEEEAWLTMDDRIQIMSEDPFLASNRYTR
jgi:hypothetical protein